MAMAKEFVADIFRRAREAKGAPPEEARPPACPEPSSSQGRTPSEPLTPCGGGEVAPQDSPVAATTAAPTEAPEPGYVNYTKLYYVLGSSEGSEPEDGEAWGVWGHMSVGGIVGAVAGPPPHAPSVFLPRV